ncbi:MAG: single-stranded DNA-binding protein [Robiginitomaculum sp.]|nr:MAG: single-stranded DNA-binding protein [Robiginitomaculum sp.]
MSFAALKKNRTKSFEALNSELQKMDRKSGNQHDDRYWKLDVDKAGNGYAIIRFLDTPDGEDLPFVRVIDHGFKGPGGWYIENSRKTLGNDEADPVAEINSELWNTGTEENKNKARAQKRRTGYHANIYIVKDTANPANEGQVKLFKFGPEIYKKVNGAMNPEYEDETAMNPFDFYDGANFKLKARNKEGGFRTYEASGFEAVSQVLPTDAEMKVVYESLHSLSAIVAPDQFKPYAELKTKLYRVLGLTGGQSSTAASADMPTAKADSAPMTQTPAASATDEDGDDLAFFKSLADG